MTINLNELEQMFILMRSYNVAELKSGDVSIRLNPIKNVALEEDDKKKKDEEAVPFWMDEDFYAAVPSVTKIK